MGLVIVFVVVVRLQFLSFPFERDEGTYFLLGQRALEGGAPYVDFYELKLPGLFYAYALLIALFGSGLRNAHFAFLVVNALTVFLVYAVGTRLLDRFAGVIAAAAFALLSQAAHVSGFTTQSEHLVVLLATSGLLLLLRAEGGGGWWLFASGVALGAAFLVKTNGLFFVAFGLVAILARGVVGIPVAGRARTRASASYLAGVVVISLVALLPVVRHGTLAEMWYWAVLFPRRYATEVPWSTGLRRFVEAARRVVPGYGFFWIAGLAGLGLVWIDPVARRARLLLVMFAGCSFLAIVPGLRFYGHYWILLLPATALASAAALHSLAELACPWLGVNRARLIVALACGVAVASNVWSHRGYYFHPDPDRVLHDVYGWNPFPEEVVVGNFLRTHTDAKDRIAILGDEPELYLYADRRPPTRHAYLGLLMADPAALPRCAEMQQEFIRDVTAAMPKYLVFVRDRFTWLTNPRADPAIVDWFPGFAREHYRLVGIVDVVSLSHTEYRWYGDVAGYRPRGPSVLVVFERRDAA